MADPIYSNERADFRKANPGLNTTQRSWSNYAGSNPVYRKTGTDFYINSPLYSSIQNMQNIASTKEVGQISNDMKPAQTPINEGGRLYGSSKLGQLQNTESQWDKLKRESALKRGMESMQNAKPVTAPMTYGGGTMA